MVETMKFYKTFEELNPDWQPPVVRNDPDPNPRMRIGKPVPPTSLAELYELHKRNGTLGIFYAEFGRDR